MTNQLSRSTDSVASKLTTASISRRVFMGGAAATALAVTSPRLLGAAASAPDELLFSSVMSLSRAIRGKQVSSEQVVRAYLDRIAAVNPQINAIATLCAERAIEEARRADAELARGKLRGILHGIPMTIKDSFDTAGVISTAGTEGRRSYIPKRDATVVARLRAAGAILLGKTNTPEFTMSYDTRNLLFGITKNPYDVTKSPGGSSGGAAAAIASGATPFDMGSDTGGSIRLPSSFCGTAGIKPTTGRMALTGHIICTGLGASDPLTQVGPMARFVADLFPLLQITAGPDEIDPAVIPMSLQNPDFVKVPKLRLAFHTDNGIQPASDDVKRVILRAASALSDTGARVEESRPQGITELNDLVALVDSFDGYEWIKLLLKRSGTERWDPHLDWHLNTRPFTGKEAGDILRDWQRFRSRMLAWMRPFDALICPVYSEASLPAAFEYNPEMLKGFSYTSAFNFTGWPGAVVRGGTSSDGMPIGVQVVAHPWREDVCLAVAKHLEDALGGWRKPGL